MRPPDPASSAPATWLLCSVVLVTATMTQADHDPPPLPDPIPESIPTGPFTVLLEDVVSNLVFPVDVQVPPDGSGRLFVTLREGKIVVIENGAALATPFLDISDTTVLTAGSALSAVVFHPRFAFAGSLGERKLYTVSQEAPGSGTADFGDAGGVAQQSVIYEWQASATNPNIVDPASRREVLRVDENTTVHNVDDLGFGPDDGYLYASKGDDDATSDQSMDGTRVDGSLLRIDVDVPGRFGVPTDNPFVGDPEGRLETVFAYGFRNPWRMSFDRNNGMLYVADIGEDDIEEVDLIEPGRYYGWIDKEGSFAFLDFGGVTDDLTDLPPDFDGVDPIAEYDHTEGDRSITGGLVYRGSLMPELIGHYVLGDFISGRLMHMAPNTGVIQLLSIDPAGDPLTPGLIGFGEDEAGELLIVVTPTDFTPTGRIVRMVGLTSEPPAPPPVVPDGSGGASMRIAKRDSAGDALTVTWDTTTCVEARGYHILFGTGSQLPASTGATYGLSGAWCDVGITSPFVWRDSPDAAMDSTGLLWWIIVAHDGGGTEGSWGRASGGGERFGPAPGGASGLCGVTAKDLSNACGR